LGSFLGRASGRASSYMLAACPPDLMRINFRRLFTRMDHRLRWRDSGRVGYSLGTITDFMVLKITANDSDTKETIYQLGGIDRQ